MADAVVDPGAVVVHAEDAAAADAAVVRARWLETEALGALAAGTRAALNLNDSAKLCRALLLPLIRHISWRA
jgi:hypothetical protein